MELRIEDIAQLSAGAVRAIPVGRIPNQARAHLSQKTSTILLSGDSVRHILVKHGDHIDPQHFLMVPAMISRGMWIADRARSCRIIYRAGDEYPPYLLALKATEHRHEVYAVTLHQTTDKQVQRFLKRGELLRESK